MFRLASAACAVSLALLATPSFAVTHLFGDNFDNDTTAPALNAPTDRWTVTRGTVDLIGNGSAGGPSFDFYPGNGYYIDMDGSTGSAGRIETKDSFRQVIGGTYYFAFDLGKNGSALERMTVGIFSALGTVFSAVISDSLAYPNFVNVSFTYVATDNAPVKLFFDHDGGDNQGYVIDNVEFIEKSVPPVPLPATGLLLIGALGMLAARRRRAA